MIIREKHCVCRCPLKSFTATPSAKWPLTCHMTTARASFYFSRRHLSPFCHEGRKMVQWWYLYFLLPQRPLPASWELTESRTHSGSRGYRPDLHLLARLAFSMLVSLGRSFGELSGLLPSQKRGGSRGPQGDSRLKVILSVGVTLCLPPWSQNWQTALPLLSDSGIIPNVIWIILIICNKIEVSGEKLISVKIIE